MTDDPPVYISAVDISGYPEIEQSGARFYNRAGEEADFLALLKASGVNTIRLRLWVDPAGQHAGFEEVSSFAIRLREEGFRIWLALHYSDTWADPGQQRLPQQWLNLSFEVLREEIGRYTQQVAEEISPDYLQVGNELNTGFLHPHGHLINNPEQFGRLMSTAVAAARIGAPSAQIIMHYAGIAGANWFYEQLSEVDYDIIGLSYYPVWHGKDLRQLSATLTELRQQEGKEVLIAETAYPFTLSWNDQTSNIVGLEEQLILPDFPATTQGQLAYLQAIREVVDEVEGGIGFCYWGAELIAWQGPLSQTASPWENQALFDFSNRANPALEAFAID